MTGPVDYHRCGLWLDRANVTSHDHVFAFMKETSRCQPSGEYGMSTSLNGIISARV